MTALRAVLAALALAVALAILTGTARAEGDLRSFDELRALGDRVAISRALFGEIGKILQHPRCTNCHSVDGLPRQGEAGRPHRPAVKRGPDGMGKPAMRCRSCHATRNYAPTGIPGAAIWHAPEPDMRLAGRPLAEVCRQWKDPARSGDRDLRAVIKHLKDDPAVAWAWQPGGTRSTPPGSQEELGRYAQAWVDTGAECPAE